MHTNKSWLLLSLTLTTGCAIETDEPLDEEALEEEDLGVVQQAIEPGVGVLKCVGGPYQVHLSQPAGNRAIKRDSSGNQVGNPMPIACSTMGISQRLTGGFVWDVVADQQLTTFSQQKPNCNACLQYQGPEGYSAPGGPPPVMYSMMVGFPTTIVNLGTRLGSPGGGYYFGNNPWGALFNPSSWCDNAAPVYGRLTNPWGFELIDAGGFSEWGTNAYQMWDPSTFTTRAASVGATGFLQYVPWFDACG